MLSVTEGEVVKCCAKWQSYEIHTLTLEVYLHSKIYQGLPPGPAQENPKKTRIEIDIGLYTQGPIFTFPLGANLPIGLVFAITSERGTFTKIAILKMKPV